jgi:hypothetical protein
MGFLNICGVAASYMTSHQILEATIRRQCALTVSLRYGGGAIFIHKVTRTIPRGKDIPELPVLTPKINSRIKIQWQCDGLSVGWGESRFRSLQGYPELCSR